ncbi:hypothetical protein VDG1235_2284 [Verrucomicrobiia bacterium DG1235]|nr:hypothetical protein VDG1235_2284 [Verrucomicrobiae bacterium DG1235]
MKLKALIALLLAAATSMAADPRQTVLQTEESDIVPIHWPQTPRPALGAMEYRTTFDGISVPMLLLQLDKLSFELSKRKSLKIRKSSSPRYSGELSDERIPGVSIGLSIFNQGEFLEDLSDQSWESYKAGLMIDKPGIEIVFENSNIESPATPYVFGQTFRQIAYEQVTANMTIKRREIFAKVGDRLLVITMSGTKDSIDQNWSSSEQLISEMSLK